MGQHGRPSVPVATCSCSLPSFSRAVLTPPREFQAHQTDLSQQASNSPLLTPVVAPGKLEGGNLSTDTAKGSTGSGELACACWLPSPPSAAELLGDPHVASFQPGPHHPILEAPLWPCTISLSSTTKEHRYDSGTCRPPFCLRPRHCHPLEHVSSLTVQVSLALITTPISSCA